MGLEVDGNNVTCLAPSKGLGLPFGTPDGEWEPFSTRGELQATPNLTPPQIKYPQTIPCHRPWGLGRGRGRRILIRRTGQTESTI